MKTTDAVAALVRDTIQGLGFELYDVEFEKEYGQTNLVIYIDGENGVDLDACERVSRAIDPIIDAADPMKEAYCLCVSSVGIDRPIKKDRDFERNMGNIVEVKLYAALDKRKDFKGTLTAFDAQSFTLEDEKAGTLIIQRKNAALIRPWIDFTQA